MEDGSLPSNTGGAANLRNVLRRVFAVLHRNKWWDKVRQMASISFLLVLSPPFLPRLFDLLIVRLL